MAHCPYIGADCALYGNKQACDEVPQIACRNRRQRIEKEKEGSKDAE